jgi:hypothetical protein
MLLRDQGDAAVAIGQASHAWISGQLARAWRAPFEPREQVCLAAEQHDVGWSEWDLRPSLNPETGLPDSFLEVPLETHIALWTDAPRRLLSQSRYAAALVSMHGVALNERRNLAKLEGSERDLVARYLDEQRELQAQLVEQLNADREQLARNQQLVWTWDSLSLALCLRWRELPGERLTLAQAGADHFTLDPWPFASEHLEVRCEGRLLESRFDDEAEMHEALACAPVVQLTFGLNTCKRPKVRM